MNIEHGRAEEAVQGFVTGLSANNLIITNYSNLESILEKVYHKSIIDDINAYLIKNKTNVFPRIVSSLEQFPPIRERSFCDNPMAVE